MNYIVTKHPEFFKKIGKYRYCSLEEMVLPDKIAIDTETTGLHPRNSDIFCVQIGTGKNNYLIHMYDGNYEFSNLVPFIEDKVLVGHNITFDLGFMYKYNFWPKEVRDTMIASKVLYNGDPTVRHDFGAVMKRELDVVYDKTEQKNIHIVKLSQASTIEYSFNDVDRLLELEEVMYQKILCGGAISTYRLHCRYTRALAYMEQCGLPINKEMWKKKMDDDIYNKHKAKEEVEDFIFDNIPKFADRQIDMFDITKRITINIGSAVQMLKVFKFLGIPTKDKDNKDSINENVISKSKHPFVGIWLKYQEASHRVSTFGNSIYEKIVDGRIYTNFNPMVDTARLSSRRGEINFLNFPADHATRDCFRAKEGNVVVVCDYGGQETVLAADLSGDEAMTKSVVDGADLHSLLARVLFPELENLSDEEIATKHKDKRTAAKSPRFAFQYGGNALTIHINEGIPLDRAQEIENGFKELHAGLYTWGDKVFKEAIKVGYIESVDGWKLKLPMFDMFQELKQKFDSITREEWLIYKIGKQDYKAYLEAKEKKEKYTIQHPKSVDLYKEKKKFISKYFKLRSEYQRLSLNNPVQTRGAHQIKLAACILFDWIVNNGYQWKILLCNSVHDELVVETTVELGELAREQVESAMLEAGNHYLTNLKIKADANIGQSWGEAK
jgi:DNA polymerase-1